MDPATADRIINDLGAAQFGLVTESQVLAAGISRQALERRVRRGSLVAVDLAIFRVAGAPVNWDQRALGHCFASGDGAMLSHRCAAMLWQLDGFREARFELLVPRWNRRQRRPGITVHESLDIGQIDRTVRAGLPCTSAVRTLIDLAAVAHPRRVDAAIESALRQRHCTLEQLVNRFVQLSRRGRRGIARLRPLLEARCESYVPTGSRFELEMVRLIEEIGLPEPVRQHMVSLRSTRVYLDLAWPDRMLAIECDGLDYHGGAIRLPWDDDRQNELSLMGWLLMRFTWKQLVETPEICRRQIREAFAQHRPSAIPA